MQVHAIASDIDPPFIPTDPCFGLVEGEGVVYKILAADRAGIFFDICQQSSGSGWLLPAWSLILDATEALILMDGFETGGTTAWSDTVP